MDNELLAYLVVYTEELIAKAEREGGDHDSPEFQAGVGALGATPQAEQIDRMIDRLADSGVREEDLAPGTFGYRRLTGVMKTAEGDVFLEAFVDAAGDRECERLVKEGYVVHEPREGGRFHYAVAPKKWPPY